MNANPGYLPLIMGGMGRGDEHAGQHANQEARR